MTEKPKILIVDDKPENLFALNKLLQGLEVTVFQAQSGVEALNLSLAEEFCVAVVDIQMPEMDGYELVELLRSNKMTATLPVIFVSAIYSDEYHHRKGYDAGAVDFLSKPFVPEILLSKIKVFIELYQQRQALQKANLTLTRLNADKDKFFSIIAHDLRGPFNALLGNAQLLAARPEYLKLDEVQEMSQSIYRSAKAVYQLLDSLLIWAQLQQEGGGMQCQPEPIELKSLTEETLAVLEQTAVQKEIVLSNTIPANYWVQADRLMLETIIRNLVGNALKFTPRGGQVTVIGKNGLESRAGWVKVSVQDTGVGMSQADIDRLFRLDASHSTPGTEKEKGSGLGLMICQEMVERNGGQIWVKSEAGQGTTVEFTVPMLDSS
ncbi:MAG: hybrid sensor histidine kinase/response regulator [Chloroflexota bacterium]|nr:MAG: hybrid sensor histidine kinase/response regulator [Chloroflexota bacterium]